MDKAKESYLQAMQIDPDDPELRLSLGVLYILQGNEDAAIEELEYAIELDAQIATAHANLALAYAMAGRFEEADEQLQLAIVQGYRNADIIRERIDNLR